MEKESTKFNLTLEESAGMTLNERLYHAGLIDAFDKALAEQNESELKLILKKVNFGSEYREFIIKQLLNN